MRRQKESLELYRYNNRLNTTAMSLLDDHDARITETIEYVRYLYRRIRSLGNCALANPNISEDVKKTMRVS